ncbi:MAG: hypothetical protein C0601_10955 [Candidatus Muiribacterium halophilum]|uniref:Nucleotidyltransferase family protein n=1 Tax=Muiribacterium halophilum TaxID=2053465 RepID=A0A2N5ZBT3_MUIH1|nr:MAG: hypothetical protein C0601_10955 [Candidatus Muirbacterium halophilum]
MSTLERFHNRKYSGRLNSEIQKEKLGDIFFLVSAKINHILKKNKIRFFFVKGIFLSQILYKNINKRPGKDIDIYIHPSDRYKALRVIKRIGYDVPLGYKTVKSFYMPFCMDFTITDRSINIDLHFYLIDVGERSLNDYFESLEILDIKGIKFPVTKKEFHLYYVIHHALKHRFEYTGMMIDIIELYMELDKSILLISTEKKFIKKAKILLNRQIRPIKEGSLKAYLMSFLILNNVERLRFLIKHFVLPMPNNCFMVDKFEYTGIFILIFYRIYKIVYNRIVQTLNSRCIDEV